MMGRRLFLIMGFCAVASLPAVGQSSFPSNFAEWGVERQQPQRLTRTAEPSTFRREKTGTAFFVDGAGHMLTARHAVEDCARVIVAKEGRSVAARVVALSPRADLALIKVPKTLGLAAVFPRQSSVSASDLMFAASYDNLPPLIARGGTLANAAVASSGGAGATLELESSASFGTSGAPVLDSRGLVEGVISRRSSINRVQAVGVAEAKAFLGSHSVRLNEDDRPQLAGGGSRAHRAASISARVTCLQD